MAVQSHRLWPFYTDQCIDDIRKLVASGKTFSSHFDDTIFLLEESFRKKLSDQKFSLFANSATSIAYSIYAHLKEISSVHEKLEIIVPAHTYRATVLPLIPLDIRPKFFNQREFGVIQTSEIEKNINRNTIGIVITHLFSRAVDLTKIVELAAVYDLPIISDCSHAHGTTIRNQKVADMSWAAFFSTGTKKLVSGGMGGILLTSDEDLFEASLKTTQPPKVAEKKSLKKLDHFIGSGFNMRATPLTARLALDHVQNLDSIIIEKNKCLNPIIQAMVQSDLFKPLLPEDGQSGTIYNLPFQINRSSRKVFEFLSRAGLRVKPYNEFLPNKEVFRQGHRDTINSRSQWGEIYYFDTRDLYQLSSTVEKYVAALNHVAKF